MIQQRQVTVERQVIEQVRLLRDTARMIAQHCRYHGETVLATAADNAMARMGQAGQILSSIAEQLNME